MRGSELANGSALVGKCRVKKSDIAFGLFRNCSTSERIGYYDVVLDFGTDCLFSSALQCSAIRRASIGCQLSDTGRHCQTGHRIHYISLGSRESVSQ